MRGIECIGRVNGKTIFALSVQRRVSDLCHRFRRHAVTVMALDAI